MLLHASGLEWMGGSWNHLMGLRAGIRLQAITVFVFSNFNPVENNSALASQGVVSGKEERPAQPAKDL